MLLMCVCVYSDLAYYTLTSIDDTLSREINVRRVLRLGASAQCDTGRSLSYVVSKQRKETFFFTDYVRKLSIQRNRRRRKQNIFQAMCVQF